MNELEGIKMTQEDLEYFRQKYTRALERNPASAIKYQKQLELAEHLLLESKNDD